MDEIKKERIVRYSLVVVTILCQVIPIIGCLKYGRGRELLTILPISGGVLAFGADYIFFRKIIKDMKEDNTKEQLDMIEYRKKLSVKYQKEIQKQEEENKKIQNQLLEQLNRVKEGIAVENIEIKDSLEEFLHCLDKTKYELMTENIVANLVLADKKEVAESKGIHFSVKADIPENIEIENVDICSVLGNILDNAIEACEKIEEKDKRFIIVKSMMKDGYWFIKVENSFVVDLQKSGKNMLETTKKDRSNHGLGTRIIKDIARKYDGEGIFEQKDDRFIVLVYLKNDISRGVENHVD